MAAVRNYSPFAARPAYDQQHHQPRSFQDAIRTTAEEDSDAYSLDARSEGSRSSNSNSYNHAQVQPRRPDVQPDNLALKSPLEQLSRTLSLNRDRENAQRFDSRAKGKGRAVERSDRDQGQQESLNNGNGDVRRPPPLLTSSTLKPNSFLELEAESPTQQTSSSSSNRYRQHMQSETRTQPVRFSDDDEDGEGDDYSREDDNSDAQSQLINAFRSSYGTHLTREGGARDSSYSWMAPDPDSPNVTMDFQQAQAVFDAAHHRGSSSRPGSLHSPAHEEEHGLSNNQNNHLVVNQGRRNELGQSTTFSEWDGGTRARARASSWDSQAAQDMGLHRIPSQKSMRGRDRGETNASSSKETDDDGEKVRTGQGQEKEQGGPPGRESGLSAFDPFQYASYESAPNSDDHSRVEDLDIPSSSAMVQHTQPSSAYSYPSASVHPTSGLQAVPPEFHGRAEEDIRPDSVYAYPLTPPTLDTAQFADAETPSSGGSDTPRNNNARHRAKSQVAASKYSRPYHSRFTQHSQQHPEGQQDPSQTAQMGYIEDDDGPTSAPVQQEAESRQQGYQSSVYPDSPNNRAQHFDSTRSTAYEDYPPVRSNGPQSNSKQGQKQLGVGAYPFNPSASYSHSPNPPRSASPLRSVSNPQASVQQPQQYHNRNQSGAPFSNTVEGNNQRPRFQQQTSSSSYNSALSTPQPQFSTRPGLSSMESAGFMTPSLSDQQSYTNCSTRPSGDGGIKRSPSTVLASAMAKHRAQREAAGLTTDGQYYVDPKTGKHYFVANPAVSGNGREAKENDRRLLGASNGQSEGKKGRRKLAKKESGWEVSKVNPATLAQKQQQQQQQQQQTQTQVQAQMQHQKSPSTSAFSVHSESDDGGGSGLGSAFTMPRKWKPWGNNRSASSREGTPESSPVQRSDLSRQQGHKNQSTIAHDDAQEWIQENGNTTPSAPALQNHSIRMVPSPGSAIDAYGGMMGGSPSPATQYIPRFETTSYPADNGSSEQSYFPAVNSHQNGGLLSAAPVSGSAAQQPRPNLHDRSGSLYSNYSYYGLPESESGHAMSRSPMASPGPGQAYRQGSGGRDGSLSPTSLLPITPQVPMASPYIPPNGAEFQPHFPTGPSNGNTANGSREAGHSRQPSTTLDKMKASVQRTGSIQLLASAKQSNLTVPKLGNAAVGKNDVLDLSKLDPNDPLACLHLGIDAHERGELERSAELFQRSADGGCGLGMLMYGLTLRHGWGCESQPEEGFQYLQKAAESVVKDLDRVTSGQIQLSEQEFKEQGAKSELVLSIYELGQCFLRGWGVSKDKKTALSYFELAANLGDPDAQSELGFCYSTGRGCKKDLKKAARYYRLAAGQGMISYGMQWIYKQKYDD